MAFDPRILNELARAKAAEYLDVIIEKWPDLVQERMSQSSHNGVPNIRAGDDPREDYRKIQEAHANYGDSTPFGINPKNGKPYKFPAHVRQAMSIRMTKHMRSPKGRKQLVKMQAMRNPGSKHVAPEVNPNTGKPYKLSAKARQNMSRGQRMRHEKGR